MDPTRSYIIAVASIIVAWVGFCFSINYINARADVILSSVTIVCVAVGFVQAIKINPVHHNIKEVAPVAIAGLIGIASSAVGIFVV